MKKTRKRREAPSVSKQLSFLPELDFTPRLPAKHTLAWGALAMMLKGKKISHPDFEDKTSSWRLAAHIHILNRLGWRIETMSVQHIASKKPRKRYIYRYFLNGKIISKFKKFSGGAEW